MDPLNPRPMGGDIGGVKLARWTTGHQLSHDLRSEPRLGLQLE